MTARLIAANTRAGIRVFPSRMRPLFDAELPAIILYTDNEPVEKANDSPREYKRSLILTIECAMSAANEATLDDDLDAFAQEVEDALFSDDQFKRNIAADGDPEELELLNSDLVLGDTEVGIRTDGKLPLAILKTSFEIPYFERMPHDGVGELDDFETIGVSTQLSTDEDVAKLEDVITIPQT